ncbi:hypothetical protein BK666_11850 [Pseudomonas frederiksbergensis]|uniref:Uncharacterized protein n=1 Tax=Pseudomonas frederiksbergensis TaxID=104087 RepID=A0A423K5G9_9PSED|nr:hypothetical protein BK666_11850 [Pseudomonas frederiksbergensis]
MGRLPVVEIILLEASHAVPVGARLAHDSDLEDAIAGKPCAYKDGVFLGVNYWPHSSQSVLAS